eukprot:CAMPEP_0167753648 /NCGR_PEP_ID=MMETSP0110_2-20121227/7832_1 /TAXON_ID=629695 /ORGANISM="Gymnochlora sp., Strain CCMP2014" /LENGTH=686 /DNA_ID=CAMNT_0007639441 /DNA_START=110 /DNA_END=2167 /DNA_ORIENTATION=+
MAEDGEILDSDYDDERPGMRPESMKSKLKKKKKKKKEKKSEENGSKKKSKRSRSPEKEKEKARKKRRSEHSSKEKRHKAEKDGDESEKPSKASRDKGDEKRDRRDRDRDRDKDRERDRDRRRRDDSRDRDRRRRDDSRDRDKRRSDSHERSRRSPRRRRRSSSPRRRRDRDRDRDRGDRDKGRRSRDADRSRRSRRDEDLEKIRKEREAEEKLRKAEEEKKRKEEEERYKLEVQKQIEAEEDIYMEEEEEPEEDRLARLAEERRKRRAAIMAQHQKKKETSGSEEKKSDFVKPVSKKVPENKVSEKKREEEEGIDAKDVVEGKEKDEFDLFNDDPEKINPRAATSKLKGNIDIDSFTDSEGYYVFRPGDALNDRFRVISNQGRGVFSTVLRVQDMMFNNRERVIKIVRGNETMYKAGQKEVEFLKLLGSKDPEGKKHCVRLLSSFEHRKHLCMVFEPMSMNLRELLRKLGHVGLSLVAIQSFAKQLFMALKLCKNCQLIHGDIKPDNILVNQEMNQIKLCDFGSASYKKDAEITPYLCSRFYRAPEIMLGVLYDEQSDIWSVGCVLYELYTGKILYPGKTNNDMLRYQMELSGNFPKRLIKKGKFKERHFDSDQVYLQVKVDPLSKLELKQPRKDLMTPTKNFHKLLRSFNEDVPYGSKSTISSRAVHGTRFHQGVISKVCEKHCC